MSDLSALIERVSQAAGPDREIDADVMAALFTWAKREAPYYSPHCVGDEPRYWHAPEPYYKREAPMLTSSLDAVVALVEREFPEQTNPWVIRQMLGAQWYVAEVEGDEDVSGGEGEGKTPALALLLAFLRAKSSPPRGDK